MPNKLATLLAALGGALAAGVTPAALAQQGPDQPSAPAAATVEVKASLDSVRQNDSASRAVVGHDELVKYGDTSVLDALKRLPGVSVTDGGVRMRGLGSGYTRVLVNGDRMPAGFSLESLAPDAIERIEIIRAATAETTLEAIAGTINIILRKSVGKNAGKNAGEFKLGAGSGAGYGMQNLSLGKSGKSDKSDKDSGFGYTLGANLTVWTRDYGSTERVAASAPGGALTQLRETTTRYVQHFRSGNANARLNWALGHGDTLSWQTFYNAGHSRGTEDNRTLTLLGPAYPYPLLPARFDAAPASLRSELGLEKRLGAGKLDTKVAFVSSNSGRELFRRGINGPDLLLDAFDAVTNRERQLTATGKYTVPLQDAHALGFGWDAGYERARQHDIHDELGPAGAPARDADSGFAATVERLAVYGQDEWDVRPGWSLYLGARWEGVRTHTTGAGLSPADASVSVFSPLVQALWKIPGSKQDQLRLALTRTYRAPALRQLVPSRFYASFNTEVAPDFMGNPGLRPELATGIDAAWEHYFGAGGLVSLSATTRAIRDVIRDTVTRDGARWVSAPVNLGGAQVRSLALELKLPLKNLGPGWPLEVRADLGRNWSSVDAVPGPGNRLDRQPRWTANLGADYSGARINAGFSFNGVTGGWTRNSQYESAYAGMTRALDAYLLLKFDTRRQLRFSARNLLAPDRVSGSRYADAGGATERADLGPSYRSGRLQYEQKF